MNMERPPPTTRVKRSSDGRNIPFLVRDAIDSAAMARSLLGLRQQQSPGHGIHLHAHDQLTKMLLQLHAGVPPHVHERDWVDIGLMAVKELEVTDPELANALMDADYDFKHAE